MRPLEPPKLKVPAPKGETQNRHRKVIGLIKRLRRSSILTTVVQLGSMSDAVVAKNAKREELSNDRAFRDHQQKFWGALDRLKKQNPFRVHVNAKIETSIQASALKALMGRD